MNEYPYGLRIDQNKIGAIGHSAGGATVFMLAGAKMSKALFQQPLTRLPQCKLRPKEYDDEDCAGLMKINFASFKKDEIEGNYEDKRIKAVIALDSGFARSFPHEQKSNIPLYIFFADKLRDHPSGEIYARDFLKVFGSAQYSIIPDSTHISFLSECSEGGLKKDVPICVGDKNKRGSIHKQTNQIMWKFFKNVLDKLVSLSCWTKRCNWLYLSQI